MGILEEIARGGRSAPISHYLKGQQEKRAGKLADLQYQVAEKKLGKMEAEEDLLTTRKETLAGFDFDQENPYRKLGDLSAQGGDSAGAEMYYKIAKTRQDMTKTDQEKLDTNMVEFSNRMSELGMGLKSIANQGPEAVQDAYRQALPAIIERFPNLSKQLPQDAQAQDILSGAEFFINAKRNVDTAFKEGKAQSLQILEPGETEPRAGTFEDGKYFIRDDAGVKREADPASQIFGKSQIAGAKSDVITPKDRSKELTKFKDFGIAQQKVVSAIDTLTKELGANKDGTLLGALGGAATTIESIAQQVRTVQKKLGGKQASSNSNDYDISGLTGLAVETSRAKSMIIDLAFSIATAREGGKLTDRDIKAALETIGANSGSIPQMIGALGVKRTQVIREYGIEHRSRIGGETPEGFFPSKKSLDALTQDELSNLSDEEFDVMLKRQQ